MIKRFYELQEKILSYFPDADIELLKKAYTIAADAHLKQKRASNEPYIIHPLMVASILCDMKLDDISIAAALLHDVLEDSDYTREQINNMFGQEIGDIVWGVTKISKISTMGVEDAQAETLKKMIVAMTSDVRVILIKLADRLHNIRTLEHLAESKRKKIARETLEIYAPIAYRLGMGKIKDELEDRAFMYTYPEEYQKIRDEVSHKYDWAMKQLEKLKQEMSKVLQENGISAEIHYRIKREISIFRKLHRQNITIDKVYDLLAMRIITDNPGNCYAIMGFVHQRWPHIPNRWRDFITSPKSNYYQSIHTTIITREGVMFEIQIRTQEMHRIAEQGIAAHWKYKEGLTFLENDSRLEWFRELIDHHKNNPDPREFLTSVKTDLTPTDVYVFTPKGRVVNLRYGSTPIDFAYAIHSEVGEHCKSAIVNEKMVPLRTKLNSGDVVEILTSKSTKPSSDWLKYAVTTRARRKIMVFLQKEENIVNLERGRRHWQRVARLYQKKYDLHIDEEELDRRLAHLHYPDSETWLREIGSGRRPLDRLTLKNLFPEVGTPTEEKPKKELRKPAVKQRILMVEGCYDIDFTFARCCSPIRGDDIVGFITTSRGLQVHKRQCRNIANALPSRLKEVTWGGEECRFLVCYNMLVEDKPGMLNTVTGIPASFSSNIRKIELTPTTSQRARLILSFEVNDIAQLKQIESQFQATDGIHSFSRRRVS